ncbi:hypothetical protein NH286_03125 [Anaerococcus sp. NML200574]|uniref:hypothetical protein n=1 Tax=Anaerococcus sp. NML200574 TaxID=2954486 RepID=UPI002237BFFA|nr:hypothetical protein [Anaerococcus sp. NML200574]MCW6678145.1 hypothetical protein [Anaerococcus sp. NML200574]
MALANINGRFQFMRATKKEWEAWDGILLDGEIAIESDTQKMKFGNGLNKYKDLDYMTIGEIIIKDLSKEDIERLRGPVGPKGDRGDKGVQGIQGKTGPKGPQGIKGDKGETGNVGPQGPIGKTGNTGPEGKQGIQGKAGPTGPKGPQGERGLTGSTGPRGEKGPKGDKSIIFSSTEPTDKDVVWVKNDNKRGTYKKIFLKGYAFGFFGEMEKLGFTDKDVNLVVGGIENPEELKDADLLKIDNFEAEIIKKVKGTEEGYYGFKISDEDLEILKKYIMYDDKSLKQYGYTQFYLNYKEQIIYETELWHKTGEETYSTASVYNLITKKWEKISEDGKMGPPGPQGPKSFVVSIDQPEDTSLVWFQPYSDADESIHYNSLDRDSILYFGNLELLEKPGIDTSFNAMLENQILRLPVFFGCEGRRIDVENFKINSNGTGMYLKFKDKFKYLAEDLAYDIKKKGDKVLYKIYPNRPGYTLKILDKGSIDALSNEVKFKAKIFVEEVGGWSDIV